jgi:cytochrome c553
MNIKNSIAVAALVVALLALGLSLATPLLVPKAPAPSQPIVERHDEEDVELGVIMSHLQRYAEKLYFAGRVGNAPLAGFYLHEIEETIEDLAKEKVVDEGMAVGEMAGAMMTPVLKRLRALDFKDRAAFEKEYVLMIETCNACHGATQHGFVKITVPKAPTYQNQSFE